MEPKTAKLIRGGAILAGALMALVALFADELGLDSSPSFGFGETLLLVVGVGVLGGALLGRRVASFYRDAATILVTTFLLLAVLELGLRTMTTLGWLERPGRLVVDQDAGDYLELPYYQGQEWAQTYWRETLDSASRSYRPYVVWKRDSYSGETVEIDERGVRRTPDAECGPESYTVLVFGGSTVWGWGAPNWGTIPAYLQEGLARGNDSPVCVVNLGESGFVSTQELVQLVLELKRGVRPDAVIFYDGVNDVFAAVESGRPMAHQNLPRMEALLDRGGGLGSALDGLELIRLAGKIRRGLGLDRESALDDEVLDRLAETVVANYLEVSESVTRLSEAYGFEAHFFWQPYILVDRKELAPEEATIVAEVQSRLRYYGPASRMFKETYARMAAHFDDRLVDLSDIFVGETDAIWIDGQGHVTPEGNRIIANRMIELLRAPLE